MTIRDGITHDFPSGQSMRAPESFYLLMETTTQKNFGDYSNMRTPPTGDDGTPDVGLVELSRG